MKKCLSLKSQTLELNLTFLHYELTPLFIFSTSFVSNVQVKQTINAPLQRITRSVAANSPKLAHQVLLAAEQKMHTPDRRAGTSILHFIS